MKLKNKKTGEIVIADITRMVSGVRFDCGQSLAELNSEWEDYEDRPYVIDMWEDNCICDAKFGVELEGIERAKECGLYFETKEEAEKAVEKLKAWKRLRDRGFRFKCWYGGSKNIDWEITSLENETYIPRQICDDLDLLFGGEE